MNWNTYNTMSKEQKEEYDYKFKDKVPIFNITGILRNTTLFMFSINFLMYTAYLFQVGEQFNELKTQSTDLLIAAMNIITFLIPIIILMCLGLLIFKT